MIEVQDVFLKYGEEYRQKHRLPVHILKAMSAIECCRTASLGGHMTVCEDCGAVQISCNSCRNRHCPKCQTLARERWVENQKSNLLNVGYFHVAFTIPDTLNTIVLQNRREMYNLLFKASAETLSELAGDKKYLGARIGHTAVLHTWGQNLMHHPHIHCIVPGGGLSPLGKWVNSRKKFFIPVRVLSRKFRGKYLFYLKQLYNQNKLAFYGNQAYLSNGKDFERLLTTLYSKEWVVYCKPPFKDSACVVEYFGRYTHRVAISNNRIVSVHVGKVTFKWRDYKDANKWKLMTLPADEFIRRFLIHFLPHRFMKIKHYGLLGNRNKSIKLSLCRQLTNTPDVFKEKASSFDLLQKITGKDFSKCPHCGSKKLRCMGLGKSPPSTEKIA
jgi:hypothetical protein